MLQAENLLTYDLEDLSQLSISDNTVTLTEVSPRKTPASVTVITHKDILNSGARSLDELLDIYVPSFASMYKTEGNQMGIRGIISDRNNKIMLLVNGKNMNIMGRDGGAVTERWFALLGDIRRITVVNGPGSAVYGPGAIAGVINIETFTGEDLEGWQASVQTGIAETFTAVEMKYGHTFDNDVNFFLYYGVDHYPGADESHATHKLAHDLTNRPWLHNGAIEIEAYKQIPFLTTPDNASFEGKPRHKVHLQLKGEHFDIWARYTKSGQEVPTLPGLLRTTNPDKLRHTGNESQQWTIVGNYFQSLSQTWDVTYTASYMVSDRYLKLYESPDNRSVKNWREKELDMKVLCQYRPEESNDALAFGMEYTMTDFGDTDSLSGLDISHFGFLPEGVTWRSHMVSFFGEYQKHFLEDWTMFAGFRADKHTYADWMYSPRLSFVYDRGEKGVLKLSYNRSVRHSDDADLYAFALKNGGNGDVETIDNFEIIYDYYQNDTWYLTGSLFLNDHNVVAYNDATKVTERIGELTFYGIEAVVNYHKARWKATLSHSYVKELDFTLENPDTLRENISASVKGYGDDLANWNNHITKAQVRYAFSDTLEAGASVRIYWGMPGAVDMADYNMATFSKIGDLVRLPMYQDSTEAFEESVFVNLDLQYQWSEQLHLSVYGYNLVGLFSERYNKQNFFQRSSQFREESPSVSIRLDYHFGE
jgi:iron complex outermembrane receptor protein